jgi:hypothetical protein
MSIIEELKKNRPNLSDSSLKTYDSVLRNLQKRMNGQGVDWFNKNDTEIIRHLKDKTPQSKKTILSALFVLTKKESYRVVMMDVMKEVNESNKNQMKNAKQTENWLSPEEIMKIYKPLEVKAKLMLNNKTILIESTIMNYLLTSLLAGVVTGLPPRRNLDYTEMMIKGYDTKKDNYYKGGRFYFNKYKTAKNYGLQILDVPVEFNIILKKWIKKNENDYLLYSSNGNKLTSPQVTKIFNNVFKSNVSSSMLRHIYISDKYKNMPALSEIDELATQMAHSPQQALEYIKR